MFFILTDNIFTGKIETVGRGETVVATTGGRTVPRWWTNGSGVGLWWNKGTGVVGL